MMPRLSLNRESVPYDGHLLRCVQRQRQNRILAAKLAEICVEEDRPLPVAPKATLAGDAQRLRGIPAVGGRGGAGGAVRGSLPHVECEKIDLATVRSLAVLVRDDVDGASPSTQPEQALLEAEEQTLVWLVRPVSLRSEVSWMDVYQQDNQGGRHLLKGAPSAARGRPRRSRTFRFPPRYLEALKYRKAAHSRGLAASFRPSRIFADVHTQTSANLGKLNGGGRSRRQLQVLRPAQLLARKREERN